MREPAGGRELRTYRTRGLIVLSEGATPTAEDLRRMRRIRRLRRDLGLPYESIDVVLRLLDRLETEQHARPPRPAVRITVIGR